MPKLTSNRCFVFGLLLSVAPFLDGASASSRAADRVPYRTGSFRQQAARFYGVNDGLPGAEIRAMAVTRDGGVFAVADETLAQLVNDRWQIVPGPAGVKAVIASASGPLAWVAAADGVWSLTDAGWVRDADSPAKGFVLGCEPQGALWVLAESGVWRRGEGWEMIDDLNPVLREARDICALNERDVFIATGQAVYGLMGKRKYWLDFELAPGQLLSRDVRAVEPLDGGYFLLATDKGLNITNGRRGWQSITGRDGLPIESLTQAAVGPDGTIWLGSDAGLMRLREGKWSYRAGRRWLPDDRVTALAPDGEGGVWVGTANGVAHVSERRMTLEEKADYYQRVSESRNRRHGWVTIMQLKSPGDFENAVQEVSDNDGLWTALYLSSQSFRYAVTKSPEAKEEAWRSMQALLRLESVTGISGFPARSMVHQDEPQFRPDLDPKEWHPSKVEEGWTWKGETSSDEMDGHYFGFYVFYELAADPEQKEQVRATCKRITDHILDHGYHLVDIDGKPTTWGNWAPESVNDDPKWWVDRGLGSVEMLSHLKVAMHIVGDARYEEAYRDLIEKHHYALNATRVKVPLESGVGHDDQLAFLSFYPLLMLEKDPGLRALYQLGLERTWEMERIEANPLWNFIYGACMSGPCDVESAVATLQEMPLDLVDWKMRNSHRADLRFDESLAKFGIKRLVKPLPISERNFRHWDSDPFVLDGGGNGMIEVDQTVWLLPYWLGRYHGLIE